MAEQAGGPAGEAGVTFTNPPTQQGTVFACESFAKVNKEQTVNNILSTKSIGQISLSSREEEQAKKNREKNREEFQQHTAIIRSKLKAMNVSASTHLDSRPWL